MGESTANVLVVDDDVSMCRILHRMLSDDQHMVQTSQSVADALGAIEQKAFDAFVMDYQLPDGSGLDIAERIRSKGSKAPILLISGYDRSAVASRAEKLNICEFLEKPFSRDVICSTLKKAISSAKEALEISPPSSPVSPALPKCTRFPFWPGLAKRRPS
jgi:DNA-binding NtrC family response regulator